jgi:hypothetical protein
MTARRDGCFFHAENAISASILYADQLLIDGGMTKQEMKQVQAELRAAIRVLRAAEDAEMICANKLARAILNARRVHEKGKSCAK